MSLNSIEIVVFCSLIKKKPYLLDYWHKASPLYMNKQIKACTQTSPGHSHSLHYRGTGVYQTTRQYAVEDDTYN